MRPRGDVRQLLGKAALALAEERGGATWRELAQRACVGYQTARRTVQNMARAGELQVCGSVRVEHARRPMARYTPRTSWAVSTRSLDNVMRSWTR